MGNIIVSGDFLGYTPTCANEDANYPATHLYNYTRPRPTFRSQDTTETIIDIDLGSAQAVAVVVISNVNFAQAYIEGDADGVWTSPDYSQAANPANDPYTNRFKRYQAVGQTYRYWRLRIPAQTPTDGAGYFWLANIVLLGSVLEMSANPGYPWKERPGALPVATERGPGGAEGRIALGDWEQWRGGFEFKTGATEAELIALSRLGRTSPMVYAPNLGDPARVYLCFRDPDVDIIWTG